MTWPDIPIEQFADDLRRMFNAVSAERAERRAKAIGERWTWADVPIESVTLLDWRRYTVLSASETAHLRALARRHAGRWQRDREAAIP